MDYFWSLPKKSIAGIDGTLGDVFSAAQVRTYDAGATLSDPGTRPGRTFTCTSGTIKVTKLLSNGREILITILEPGSIWSDCALLKGYWREVFVEAMSTSQIVSIENERFEQFVQARPAGLSQFMTRISEQMSDALTLLEDFRGRDVASRLASVLVRFCKQYGVTTEDAVVIELPFTHQDLANMIGTARETVSRNMARFRTQGYVRDSQTATIEILSLRSLEALIG